MDEVKELYTAAPAGPSTVLSKSRITARLRVESPGIKIANPMGGIL
jgi:hypothetical protein